VIIEKKLDRHREPSTFLGRHEVAMIIKSALDRSTKHGRALTLQSISGLLMCFYLTLRPSTLAAPYKEFRTREWVCHINIRLCMR
jgi:hypothetical protein